MKTETAKQAGYRWVVSLAKGDRERAVLQGMEMLALACTRGAHGDHDGMMRALAAADACAYAAKLSKALAMKYAIRAHKAAS